MDKEFHKLLAVPALTCMAFGLVLVALPLYLDAEGWKLDEIGSALGAATLLGGLLSIGVGRISDSIGRKKALLGLNAVDAASKVLLGLVSGVGGIAFAKALSDFAGATVYSLLHVRVIDVTAAKERAKAFGYLAAVLAVSSAIALFLAGAVINAVGYKNTFFVAAAFIAVATPVILSFKRVHEKKQGVPAHRRKGFKTVAAVNLLFGFAAGASYVFLVQLYLKTAFRFDAGMIGAVLGAICLVWGASSYFLGGKSDEYGIPKIICLTGAGMAITWFALGVVENAGLFIALIIIDSALFGVAQPALRKLQSSIGEGGRAGQNFAGLMFFEVVGQSAGLYLAGILAITSFTHALWLRGIAFALVAAIAATLLKKVGEK